MSKRSKGINNKKTTEMQVKRMNKVNRNKHYINYFAALLLFGSNGFVAEKISMDSYGIVFWRVAVGLAAILIILFIKRRQDQKEQKAAVSLRRACHRHIAYNYISGAAQGISWLFLFEAYSRAGVGLSTLIYYFGPALVMALSPLVFKESFTGKKAVCFAAVLCGMLLVNKQSGSGNDFTGILFAAISAVFFALMMIFNKKATSVTGISNAMIQLAGALPVTLIFAVFKGGIPVPQSMEDFFLIIIIGAVNTGLGMFLYLSSLGQLSIQTASVCGYIEPLSALGFSVVLLGESMLPIQMLGGAMILAGALFMEMSPKKLLGAVPEHVKLR